MTATLRLGSLGFDTPPNLVWRVQQSSLWGSLYLEQICHSYYGVVAASHNHSSHGDAEYYPPCCLQAILVLQFSH